VRRKSIEGVIKTEAEKAERALLPLFPPSLIFVHANMTTTSTSAADLLLTVAEPTRLRILNCLAAAPLFVSDLQAILDLPQPTVSRHLQVLRRADLVRDTPIAQFVLYRLRREPGASGKVLTAILDAVRDDVEMRAERDRAANRSRSHIRTRVESPLDYRTMFRAKSPS
jgi:ArsR family transcriptional regulator, arsenate/arsenite/antimonite-responsive transcriptional repressor